MPVQIYVTRRTRWDANDGPPIEQHEWEEAAKRCTDKAWCLHNRLNGKRIATRLASPSIVEQFSLVDGNVCVSNNTDEIACLALDLAAELDAMAQSPTGENLYYDDEKQIRRTRPGLSPPHPELRHGDAVTRESPWKQRVLTALGLGLLSLVFKLAVWESTRVERKLENQIRFLQESRYHLEHTPDYQEMVKRSVRAGLYSEEVLRIALSSDPEILDMLLAELPDKDKP